MATITPTITYNPDGHRQLVRVVWANLATGDDGAPVNLPSYSDGSVQIEGTFGGATVTLQGRNDGVNWQAITDPQGNDIAKTAADLEQITEIARELRPLCAGGAGSGLTVTLILRRTP